MTDHTPPTDPPAPPDVEQTRTRGLMGPGPSSRRLPLPAGALVGGFEQLVTCHDPEGGLLAIVCIDSTVLGPADGGVRMRPYADHAAAVHDVTRLARAMTRKYAAAGEQPATGLDGDVADAVQHDVEALGEGPEVAMGVVDDVVGAEAGAGR